MTSLIKPLCLCAIALLLPALTPAAGDVDFENVVVPEANSFASVPGHPALSLSGVILVKPGSPTVAFNGGSQGGAGGPDDAGTGQSFSTPLGASGTTMTLSFSEPVSNLSVELLDVEVGSVVEVIACRVYNAADILLHTIVVTGGDPGTGDGLRTTVDFSSGFPGTSTIRRLELQGTFSGQSTTAGWGVDNLFYTLTAVPTEAHTWGSIKALYDE